MSPDVSIVIVTYRVPGRGARLPRLASTERTHGVSFEVVVVDNGRGDGTAEAIRHEFQAVTARRASRERRLRRRRQSSAPSRGPASTCSCSIPTASSTRVPSRELVEFARANPRHGIYGGRTLWPDGTLCPGSCWGQPSLWSLFCFATLLSTALKGSRVFDPESLGRLAARQRARGRHRRPAACCLLPATSGRSWEASTSASSCTARMATSRFAPSALGLRPVDHSRAVTTHEVGVSSASRGRQADPALHREGNAAPQALGAVQAQARPCAALARRRAFVPWAGWCARPSRRRSGWIAVWRARRSWLRGYAYRESAAPRRRSSRFRVTLLREAR